MKKLLVALLTLIMLTLTACGGGTEPVASANGVITVTPSSGYEATSSDSYEMITIKAKGAKESNDNYIEIEAPGLSGYPSHFTFYAYSDSPYQYRRDADYSMEMLKSDVDTYVAKYPNIYKNPTEVKIGDYDYIRVDCVTNGEASNYYFTVVNKKPCIIGVVSGDDIELDSDDVKAMLESIKFNVK